MQSHEINISSRKINITIESSDLGLCIKYQDHDNTNFKVLSRSSKHGKIFHTTIPSKYLRLLFMKPKSTLCSEESLHSCVVVCDNREVFLISLNHTIDPKKLFTYKGNVIWVDFIKDSFLVLDSYGKLCRGTLKDTVSPLVDLLDWSSVKFPVNPVSCVAANENFLILTDGYSSFLLELNKEFENLKELKRLCFCGVTKLEKKNLDIIFYTCDGRKYSKSIHDLTIGKKNFISDIKDNSIYAHNLTLENVIKSMKRFADNARRDKSEVENLNLYIEQFCIAKQLLSKCEKPFFSISLNVSHPGNSEAYLLNIQLQQVCNLRICGRWWQLKVKVSGSESVCFLYSELFALSDLSQSVSIKVPFKTVESLVLDQTSDFNIDFFLVFSEYNFQSPICCLKVHEEPLDVLCFLTSMKDCTLPALFSYSFYDKLDKLYEAFRDDKKTIIEELSSNEKTSLKVCKKYLPVIEHIFPDIKNTDSQFLSVMKWLQNVFICITCDIGDNYCIISIEGTSRPLVMAVKFALEKRALRYQSEDDKSSVLIPHELLRKISVAKTVLDVEFSDAASLVIVRRIYHHVESLINEFCI